MINKFKQYRILIPFIIAVIVFGGLFIYVLVNTGPKTPLTCEQFDTVAKDLGYVTTDTSSDYTDYGESLIGCRKIVSDDFRFEYFEFDSSDMAKSLYSTAYTQIIKKRSQHDAEYSSYYNNYRQYGLRSNGKYYMTTYVGNTSVYVECKEEYMGDIYDILEEMNYNPKNSENKE